MAEDLPSTSPIPPLVLSLRQPWAWMVVHGGKRIENRRWNTRVRAEFLIHAARGMTRDEYDDAVYFAKHVNPKLVVPRKADLLFGGIMGRAKLVSVIAPHDPLSLPALADGCGHPWHVPDQYGFVLEDVFPMPFRPLRGELGFFPLREKTAGQ